MVNKVDGNNYYTYTNQKKIDVLDTDEKFSLGYQKNESSPDAKDKKEISEQEKQQTTEQSGVRLELSTNAQEQNAGRQKKTEDETAKPQNVFRQIPLLETIRTYVMTAIAAVRGFFHQIWNDQPQEEISDVLLLEENLQEDPSQESVLQDVQSSEDILQEPAEITDASDDMAVYAMEEERRNREIQQSLRDGDMDHVVSLLTDNGRKTAARNSSLLTSYDKNGRVVEPSASVWERVLHGDKNTWKL